MTTADGSLASVPTNGELFNLSTKVVRHFLLADVPVTRCPFVLRDGGDDLDADKTASLFSAFRSLPELADAFEFASYTEPARDSVRHPALSDIGSAKFYGGVGRDWDSASTLIGPIWFGRGVKIRVSAKIIGPSLIDDYAFINTAAKITRSILGRKCQVEEDVTIKDAIIGSNVVVCAGARLSSRCEDDPRHEREVVTQLPGKTIFDDPISTGRRKMGPIVGDGCVIGANAVLKPGVILLPGYKVPAGRVMHAGIYHPQ